CGTNQPGDIVWLADVARPNFAVFTNIGESHLEKLKTISGVLKEKWALTSFMGPKDTVLINADDARLSRQSRKKYQFKILTYGFKAKAGRTAFAFAYNALAAASCGKFFKVVSVDIAQGLKNFKVPKGRGQIVRLGT